MTTQRYAHVELMIPEHIWNKIEKLRMVLSEKYPRQSDKLRTLANLVEELKLLCTPNDEKSLERAIFVARRISEIIDELYECMEVMSSLLAVYRLALDFYKKGEVKWVTKTDKE